MVHSLQTTQNLVISQPVRELKSYCLKRETDIAPFFSRWLSLARKNGLKLVSVQQFFVEFCEKRSRPDWAQNLLRVPMLNFLEIWSHCTPHNYLTVFEWFLCSTERKTKDILITITFFFFFSIFLWHKGKNTYFTITNSALFRLLTSLHSADIILL